MGTIEDLTETQKKKIDELRLRLKNDLPRDMFEDTLMFYKFLIARNFNLNQAESMLRKHLEFRKIVQIDTILMDYKTPEVCDKYISQNFIGYDKEGCPVYFSALGNIDHKGVFKSANKIDIFKCCIQVIEGSKEKMKLQSKKLDKPVTQCIYIYDMDNLTLAKATHKHSIELFLIAVGLFLDNYPEILKSVYVLNASSYFTLVFPLVKTILSGSILNKITIFGKDGYKEELLKVIDAETLPAFLGGKKTDPDGNPRCETFINWAGPVPEKYFLTKNIAKISKRKDIKKVIVPNKTCHEVKIQVNQCNMILEWEYELKNHDIGFKILFEDRNPDGIESMEIIPMYKFETEYEPIKGMLRCKRKGTYIIAFDNSYSWFNSKEVYYKIWLTTTKDKTND